MRFTLTVAMLPPEQVLPLATAADKAGFDGVAVPDSVFFPREVSAGYPYTPDGSRFWDEDTPFVDPLVAIPAMAAVTTRLRFVTNVLKLPIRHPLPVAKQVGSIAAMFPGRLALGVGLSWIPEEFEWLGWEKRTRGDRLDEEIEVIRGCLTPGWAEHEGRHYSHGALRMSPVPEVPVPILVGGHSEAALDRAARRGDGWVSAMIYSPAEAAGFVDALTRRRRDAGREGTGFEVIVTPVAPADPEVFAAYRDAGTTEVIVAPWFLYGGGDLDAKVAAVQRFAADVIRPLAEST